MSQRWYVSKDGAQLGPYTAADLRELLRSGTLDPFDLIWQEGSQVKRQLVDVDLIFQTEGVEYDSRGAAGADLDVTQIATLSLDDDYDSRPPERLDARGEMPTLTLDDDFAAPHIQRQAAPQQQVAPRLMVEDAYARPALKPEEQRIVVPEYTRPHVREQKARQSRRKNREPSEPVQDQAKKYFVVDKTERLLGPLSAKEIQSLFFKGVLDRSVRVLKTGTNKRIPITKFVSVYAKKSLKEAMAAGQGGALVGGPAGLPRSPVLQQMAIARFAQAQERERLLPWIVGGVLIGMLLLTGVILSQRYEQSEWPFERSINEAPGVRDPDAIRQRPDTSPKLSRPQSGKLPRGSEQQPTRTRPRRTERQEPAPVLRSTPQPRVEPVVRPTPRPVVRELPRPTAQPRLRERPTPAPRVVSPRARPTPRPVVRVTPRPAPIVAPVVRSTPAPVRPAPVPQPPRNSGPSLSELQNGQTVTLAGMSYSKSEIQSCPDDSVCAVTFVGAGGAITGRFFKGTFGQKLLQMPGRATISGRVTKIGGGTSILVVGVR